MGVQRGAIEALRRPPTICHFHTSEIEDCRCIDRLRVDSFSTRFARPMQQDRAGKNDGDGEALCHVFASCFAANMFAFSPIYAIQQSMSSVHRVSLLCPV